MGLERAGWQCRWQIEKNEYRRSVLSRRWPEIPHHSDIRKVKFEQLESVDLVAGGIPCQPVSSAGKRQAQSDERWLWPEFCRAIRSLRPRFALIENVTGLLHRGFGDILADLAEYGYDAEWQMFPAVALGAPHIRARMWIVAYTPQGRLRTEGNIEESTPFVFRRDVTHAIYEAYGESQHWRVEPDLVRMVDGYTNGMGRYVAALGDAVVPQVGEFIGRLMLQAASRGETYETR